MRERRSLVEHPFGTIKAWVGHTHFLMKRPPNVKTEAAQAAAIHDDILAMSRQYETLNGEMGSSLSGGRNQRLLLARALYRQPRVLGSR